MQAYVEQISEVITGHIRGVAPGAAERPVLRRHAEKVGRHHQPDFTAYELTTLLAQNKVKHTTKDLDQLERIIILRIKPEKLSRRCTACERVRCAPSADFKRGHRYSTLNIANLKKWGKLPATRRRQNIPAWFASCHVFSASGWWRRIDTAGALALCVATPPGKRGLMPFRRRTEQLPAPLLELTSLYLAGGRSQKR